MSRPFFPARLFPPLIALLLLALFGVTPIFAQSSPIEVSEVAYDSSGTLTFTIRSSVGTLAEGFVPEVLVDGEPAGRASALGEPQLDPIPAGSVVIAIEVSASMSFGLSGQAAAAAFALLDQLDPDDRVAVVSFGNEVRTVSDFTTNRSETRAAIDGLQLEVVASLYRGVEASLRLLDAEAGVSAVVLLAFGWDFGEGTAVDRQASILSAQSAAAAVFPYPLGGDFDIGYLRQVATPARSVLRPAGSATDFAGVTGYLNSGPAFVSQPYRIELPALAPGAHRFSIAPATGAPVLAGDVAFEVAETASVSVAFASTLDDAGPLTGRITTTGSASGTTLAAFAAGRELAVDQSTGEFSIDPWRFAPGTLPVQVTASSGGVELGRATVDLTIAALEPRLSVRVAGENRFRVETLVQGSPTAEIVVEAGGVTLLRTMERSVEFPAPNAAEFSVRLESGGEVIQSGVFNVATLLDGLEGDTPATIAANGVAYARSMLTRPELRIPAAIVAVIVVAALGWRLLGLRSRVHAPSISAPRLRLPHVRLPHVRLLPSIRLPRRSRGGRAAVDERHGAAAREQRKAQQPRRSRRPKLPHPSLPHPSFRLPRLPRLRRRVPSSGALGQTAGTGEQVSGAPTSAGPYLPPEPSDAQLDALPVTVRIAGAEGEQERVVEFHDAPISIGASRTCDLQLDGDGVRFVHAMVSLGRSGELLIFPLGPVSSSGGQQRAGLFSADEPIEIAGYRLRFKTAA